jgi:hypothetical protein
VPPAAGNLGHRAEYSDLPIRPEKLADVSRPRPELFRRLATGKGLRRPREITESIATVMAGLVPAIHVVQLKKQKRFATISQLRSIEL